MLYLAPFETRGLPINTQPCLSYLPRQINTLLNSLPVPQTKITTRSLAFLTPISKSTQAWGWHLFCPWLLFPHTQIPFYCFSLVSQWAPNCFPLLSPLLSNKGTKLRPLIICERKAEISHREGVSGAKHRRQLLDLCGDLLLGMLNQQNLTKICHSARFLQGLNTIFVLHSRGLLKVNNFHVGIPSSGTPFLPQQIHSRKH